MFKMSKSDWKLFLSILIVVFIIVLVVLKYWQSLLTGFFIIMLIYFVATGDNKSSSKRSSNSSRASKPKTNSKSSKSNSRESKESDRLTTFLMERKFCATCRRWEGIRKIINQGHAVSVQRDAALCQLSKLSTHPRTGVVRVVSPTNKIPNATCSDWEICI